MIFIIYPPEKQERGRRNAAPQPLKIYRCVYLPKQVICWHQTFRVHHFYDPALIFPTF